MISDSILLHKMTKLCSTANHFRFSRLLAEDKFERFSQKQKQSVRGPEIIETPIRLPARFTNGGVDWIYGGK
jgi:hypothetical protein